MGGPHGDRACQQMLWVHRWGNASSIAAPAHQAESGFGRWEQGNTTGDRDCSEMGWLQAPVEGMCNFQRLWHHQVSIY